MIKIVIGGAGTGKSTYIMEQIEKSVLQGEHVITLIPEQFSYEFDQKLYGKLGAVLFNQLETHSFKSMARALFQRYGTVEDGRTYADELTKTALLYQALRELTTEKHMLRFYEKQCQQISFVEELSTVISQMRRNGVTAEILYETSGAVDGRLRVKMLDLALIIQSYDRLLLEHEKKDTESDLTEAAVIANGQDAFLGDYLFIDEFESFTEDEYEMLAVLFSSCKEVVIALRTDSIDQAPFSLFASVQETYHRICRMAKTLHIPIATVQCTETKRFRYPDLQWISAHVFRNSIAYEGNAEHIYLFEAETPNEEVDYVCATIYRLLAENPELHCRDIAVLTNQMPDYQSILENVMDRYGLPYHLNEKKSMLYMPLLIYIHTLMELICARQPDTEWILRLGKTQFTSCTPSEMAVLENYCYTWQIEGKTWNEPFVGGDCEEAEKIRKKIWEPVQAFRQNWKDGQTGAAYCQMLYEYLVQQDVENRMNVQLLQELDVQKRMQVQQEWVYVWNSFIEILEHLSEIYQNVAMEKTAFRAVLFALTRTIQQAIPPRTLDAILLSQGNTARLNAPKIVFLLGICEGTFPTQPKGSALFSQRDCLELEKQHLILQKRKEGQLADARLAAYKLMTSASHALYITYPKVNVAHQKCYPAAVVEQIEQMFLNTESFVLTREKLGPAYYACNMRTAYYQYVQNYAEQSVQLKSIFKILSEDPFYHNRLQKLQMLLNENEPGENMPLHQIADLDTIASYMGNTLHLSASSLERYQLCPFSYFCSDILRLYTRSRIGISGVGSGSMIHYCLEKLLKEYGKETFCALSLTQLQEVVAKYGDEYWCRYMGGSFSKSGRELALYRYTISGMLPMLLHMQEEFRQSAFIPYRLELKISADNLEFPPICLQTPSGKKIQFSGKVDRVDLCQDGDTMWVRVVDYKSGTKTFSIGNILYGLDMQMLLYLFAITAPDASLSHATPAGVLYLPSGKVKSDLKRGDSISPEKHLHDTYRMNGVLLRDSHLITLMEQKGEGIYIPGKLDANHQIDERSGTFVTPKQMKQLHQYVEHVLVQMGIDVYAGKIDANPLEMQKYDPCTHCSYGNICGNREKIHMRIDERTQKQREKALYELLESMGEEEEER